MNNLLRKIKIWFILNVLIKIWQFSERIKVKIANSQEEIEEIFRFRWKIYKEAEYITLEDFPNQQLSDKYDKNSLNIFALKDGTLAGCVRFILPSEIGLPTEKAFNLKDLNFPKNEMGEISKLCIDKKYRKTSAGKKMFLIFMAEFYKFTKKNNMKYALIGTDPRLKRCFEKVDFQLSIEELPTGPLEPQIIEERMTAKKYFEKSKVTPYLITIV